MKILITNFGTIIDNVTSTCVLKRLKRRIENTEITWGVKKKADKHTFKYNKSINRILDLKELINLDETFDLLINLSPFLPHKICNKIKILNTSGFGFNEEVSSFESVINGVLLKDNMNIFQMYYTLAGMTWKGEGYDIGYNPKSRSKKNRAGIAVVNANLRNYLTEELELGSMKLWNVPYRKNIFKKMDEINKCSKIITDDILTLHLSLSLRKYVYFLKTNQSNTKIEFFGNGEFYEVPKKVFG
ncbi:MAG: hypothetical protein KAH05_06985 [Clostridiales bacterium]|nr:hypothetical protein [Clostridiales bacterium]